MLSRNGWWNRKHLNPCRRTMLFFVLAALVVTEAQAQDAAPPRVGIRFVDQIEAYVKQDKIDPPPRHAILFIGSSIFRQWTNLKEQMAPLPVFNRAFGGSRTDEVLQQVQTLVLPYEPRIIVYYCGSNDVNAGVSARQILGNFEQFCKEVGKKLPRTVIFFVSINRAPQKESRWSVVDSANNLVREHCLSHSNSRFIDVNPVLFDKSGAPRLELYRDDKLHFKEPAYVEFTRVIRPVLEAEWKKQ